ncbi:MAG: ribose-5-phosphate isomerase RpiA [Chloroflexi bacterium]|nr:MAG: ribose-5-phosphate isomerase RpiA [Chloroflexota bacterium]MBL1193742.1 ribose-5-phosphate isomerase RpiA [Chloroflexota bacterium]NOH11035.1 ribose-5-phosphate isomerase RpiA [Chloroflexota bacterium]
MSTDLTEYKKQAGHKAVEFVESGMVVGLGHGSTAIWAVRRIAELLKEGQLKGIQGIPCSSAVEEEAQALEIPLTDLNAHPQVDITIDGADEVDPELNLIKGGGGALLREKMVAQASQREIIVIDAGKRSDVLGTNFALPVEVVQFGWEASARFIEEQGAKVSQRLNDDGTPFISDQHNYILDCDFGPIADLGMLDFFLKTRVGIVEHGLFLGMATDLIVAGTEGIEHIQAEV